MWKEGIGRLVGCAERESLRGDGAVRLVGCGGEGWERVVVISLAIVALWLEFTPPSWQTYP